MAVSAKILALTGFALLAAGSARAQQAQPGPAGDRCEGTLCDLYYSTRGTAPEPAKAALPAAASGIPAGATPLTVPQGGVLGWFGGSGATRPSPPPSEEASSTNSYMHLGAGGLLGDRNQRCTGTLCDTIYGSSPEPAAAGQQATAAMAPAAASEPVVPHRHLLHESETRPKCSSPTADPWHCMR